MILELLLSQWKLVLIAALMVACGYYRHGMQSVEKELVAVNIQFQLARDAAKAETKKAQDISTTTAKEINDGIPKLVAEAQTNAVENYRRRYGNISRPVVGSVADNLGSGIRSDVAVGVRSNEGTAATGPVQADFAKGSQSAAATMDVAGTCDQRFITEAAFAAVIIRGWNQWAERNGLEFEK